MTPSDDSPREHQDRNPNMSADTLDNRICDKSNTSKDDRVQECTGINTIHIKA